MKRACDENAPKKEFSARLDSQSVAWFTPELEEKIRERNNLLQKQREFFSSKTKTLLKMLTNEIGKLKSKLKRLHYSGKMEECAKDGRKLWELLREATRSQKVEDNTLPNQPDEETASNFNRFFATIGWKTFQAVGGKQKKFVAQSESGFTFPEITKNEIEAILDSLKPKTAVGHDDCERRRGAPVNRNSSEALRKLYLQKQLVTCNFETRQ